MEMINFERRECAQTPKGDSARQRGNGQPLSDVNGSGDCRFTAQSNDKSTNLVTQHSYYESGDPYASVLFELGAA